MVVVITPFVATPVYHELVDVVYDDTRGNLDVTRCGRRNPTLSSSWIREDHAAKFGRPCRHCFEVSP